MKKNKVGKDILRVLLLAVCGLVLGLNIYTANAKSLVGNHLPMPFGYGAAVVLSGSMEPTLSVGDLILVKESEAYAEGDIVVYQDVNCLVVHRVMEVNKDTITTKGDANNVADKAIGKDYVKGCVFFWIPALGHVVNFAKSGVGTVLILLAAFLLIEIPRRKEQQRDNEERQKIIAEIERLRKED